MNNSIYNLELVSNSVVAFICIDPDGKPRATKLGMLTGTTQDS